MPRYGIAFASVAIALLAAAAAAQHPAADLPLPQLSLSAEERAAAVAAAVPYPGFTHEPSGSLSESRVGRSPIEAIGDEWHDRRFGGVLHGA
jgi:hypothetical protein